MAYYPRSKTDRWQTPPELYRELDREFHFDFDPAPLDWKRGDPDGLEIEWGRRNFVNPPYSQAADWIRKAHEEWKKGKTVVMLLNATTDTDAFHRYIYGQAEIRFLRGRLKFVDPRAPDKSQPNVRASMVVVFRASKSKK